MQMIQEIKTAPHRSSVSMLADDGVLFIIVWYYYEVLPSKRYLVRIHSVHMHVLRKAEPKIQAGSG